VAMRVLFRMKEVARTMLGVLTRLIQKSRASTFPLGMSVCRDREEVCNIQTSHYSGFKISHSRRNSGELWKIDTKSIMQEGCGILERETKYTAPVASALLTMCVWLGNWEHG
jgi:hypothetical protein